MHLKKRLSAIAFSFLFLFLGSAFAQKVAIETDVKGVSGSPSKGAEVLIERQDKKVAPLIGKTDRRGRLQVTDLDPGTYKLTVTVEGGIRSSEIVKTETSKTRVIFDMRKNPAITSKVKKRYVWVEPETGTALGGHWVEVNEGSGASKSSGQNVDVMNANSMNNIQRMTHSFRPAAPGGQ